MAGHFCRSKRLQQAVKGISKAPNPELMMEDYGAETPKAARERNKKGGSSEAEATAPGMLLPGSLSGCKSLMTAENCVMPACLPADTSMLCIPSRI